MFDGLLFNGEPTWFIHAVAWLLTYLMHSTLLLGGAWLASRWLKGRLEPIAEILWKSALVGGVVTATLQTGGGIHPIAGQWGIGGQSAIAMNGGGADLAVAHPRRAAALEMRPNGFSEEENAPRTSSLASPSPSPSPSARPNASAALSPADTQPSVVAEARQKTPSRDFIASSSALAIFLIAISTLGLFRLAWAQLRLKSNRRRAISKGPLHARLQLLLRTARIRQSIHLTSSARISVPMAMGSLRQEICVPPRALTDLATPQQDTMLAHELAHLLRHDPLWLAIARAIELVFWFQPLNRIARRRLQESAEFASDAWAAEQTNGHLPLARCLTEVASWSLAAPASAQYAAAIHLTRSPSTLGKRISRLLNPVRTLQPQTIARLRWMAPLLLLFTATTLAPSVAAIAKNDDYSAAELIPPKELPLPEALQALDLEVSQLRAEIAALDEALRETPGASITLPLIDQISQKAVDLTNRAGDLRALGDTGILQTNLYQR